MDKFENLHLTKERGNEVSAPLIKESPVNIECKVTEIKELGSHNMIIAKVLCVDVDEKYIDKRKILFGKLRFDYIFSWSIL